MEKKRMLQIIGSLVIAVILVVSYAAAGAGQNNQPPSSSPVQAQSSAVPVWHATGYANATIARYAGSLKITSACNQSVSNQTLDAAFSQLSGLAKNNSVLLNQFGGVVFVQLISVTPMQIYASLASGLNSSALSCIRMYGSTYVMLPGTINFNADDIYSPSVTKRVSIAIQNSSRERLLQITISNSSRSLLGVEVTALLDQNFSVIGNFTVIPVVH
jgi:hypothetical protein